MVVYAKFLSSFFLNEMNLNAAANNGDLNMIKLLMTKKRICVNIISVILFIVNYYITILYFFEFNFT